MQTLKAIIKNSCGGHIPGVLVCYHYLREKGLWNWDAGAEFRISIKKPELQGLRP